MSFNSDFTKRRISLYLALLGVALVGVSVWWLLPAGEVQAQCTTPSSCKTCHEVLGEKPVNYNGDIWHQQHAIFDFCEACHGGNRLAEDAASAHMGLRRSYTEMAPTCKGCHSTELESCLGTYAGDLGITGGDFDQLLEVAVSSPVGAGALIDQLQSGTLVGPQMPSPSGAAEQPAAAIDLGNPLNLILLAALVLGLAGAVGYVAWNERRLKQTQGESLAALSRLVGYVRQENWSPYAAGVLLGIVSILAVLIGNHLLSAAGPVATIASSIVHALAPAGAEGNMYFRFVVPPELSWPVMLFIGIILGGALGALSSGTFRLRWSDDPVWRKVFGRAAWKRVLVGFVGALFLQYGASIAGGCTSGLAISGGMLLTPSAFLFMAGMFASGILTAWLVYRRRY